MKLLDRTMAVRYVGIVFVALNTSSEEGAHATLDALVGCPESAGGVRRDRPCELRRRTFRHCPARTHEALASELILSRIPRETAALPAESRRFYFPGLVAKTARQKRIVPRSSSTARAGCGGPIPLIGRLRNRRLSCFTYPSPLPEPPAGTVSGPNEETQRRARRHSRIPPAGLAALLSCRTWPYMRSHPLRIRPYPWPTRRDSRCTSCQ